MIFIITAYKYDFKPIDINIKRKIILKNVIL